MSSHCVRETVEVRRTTTEEDEEKVKLQPVAYVTERGALVLRVLGKYVDEKHDAFVGCGREEIKGSRSEVDARKAIAEINGFMAAVRAAMNGASALQTWLSAHFEYPQPSFKATGTQLGVTLGTVVEASPQAMSTLRLPEVPSTLAQAIPVPPQGHVLSIGEELSQRGRAGTDIIIRGPYDVLRWVADDLDARWHHSYA